MLKHHLKSAFRNLSRNKLYAAVSVGGLAVGLAVCLLAVRYILYEYSFDRVRDEDRVYQVYTRAATGNGYQTWSFVPQYLNETIISKLLVERFPQIESAVYCEVSRLTVQVEGKSPHFLRVCEGDKGLLKLYGFKLVQGSPATCLSDLHSVVLTEEGAKSIFGSTEVLGRTLRMRDIGWPGWREFTVTALMKDVPGTSSLTFSAIIPVMNDMGFRPMYPINWISLGGCCFIKVRPHTNIGQLASMFPQFEKSTGGNPDRFALELRPMKAVHFADDAMSRLQTYNPRYLYIFSAIALLVLAVSIFNFMGINATMLSRRYKEISVRKIVGATKKDLAARFLVENSLLVLSALLLAFGLSELLLPFTNSLLGVTLTLDYFGADSFLLFAVCAVVAVLLIVTVYVGYSISTFSPHTPIQGVYVRTGSRSLLRRVFIFAQFVIAAFLITVTLIGLSQLYFIAHKNLGFNRKRIIVISGVSVGHHGDVLRTRLEQDPDILFVSESNWFPSLTVDVSCAASPAGSPGSKVNLDLAWADPNLVPMLGLKLVGGRNFSFSRPTDSNAVILNQVAERRLGGAKRIILGVKGLENGGFEASNASFPVIGVVKDFNYESLRQSVQPFAIQFWKTDWPMLGVRYRKGTAGQVLAYIRSVWKEVNPDRLLEYRFLSDAVNKEYLNDGRMFEAFAAGSLAAVLIALTGVFALSFFLIETRTKEVAVRKVLGSSVSGIVGFFSNSFLKLIVAANIVSWPVAYLVMKDWMQSFAYRGGIHLLIFPAVMLGMICLGFLTILFHVLKAARANPVESLRYE